MHQWRQQQVLLWLQAPACLAKMLRLLSAVVLLALLGVSAAIAITVAAALSYVLMGVVVFVVGVFLLFRISLTILSLFRPKRV